MSQQSVDIGQSVLLSWQSADTTQTYTYNLDVKKPWDNVYYRRLANVSSNQFNRYIGAAGTHIFKVNACNTLNVCGEFAELSIQATTNSQSCDWSGSPQARQNASTIGAPVEFSWDKSRYSQCTQTGASAQWSAELIPQVCGNQEYHRELYRFYQTGTIETEWTCTIRDTQQDEVLFAPVEVTLLSAPENLKVEESVE